MKQYAPALVCAFVIGAGIVWFAAPRPALGLGTASAMGMATDDWHLPSPPALPSHADLELLSTPAMWGIKVDKAGTADDKALTPPNWRVIGVFRRGDASQVVVRSADSPTPQLLSVGDALPGGSRILTIDEGFLAIELNGKRRVLRINGS